MRVEGVRLEYHGDVPVLRRDVIHQAVAYIDVALGQGLQAGEEADDRGLPAAGRADEDQEFLVGNLQRQVVDGNHIAEALCDVLVEDACHLGAQPSSHRLNPSTPPPSAPPST